MLLPFSLVIRSPVALQRWPEQMFESNYSPYLARSKLWRALPGEGMTSWLHEQRLEAVQEAIRQSSAQTVLDLGCGEGDLLVRLVHAPGIARLVGVDICREALGRLRARIDALTPPPAADIELLHGSLLRAGRALTGFDCAVLVEAIEHIPPGELAALERAVFAKMRPRTVIVTTPNAEFNTLLGVPPERFRHPDHCFEWGRARFRRWAARIGARYSYAYRCEDIAGRHPALGGASQMAVFTRGGAAGTDQKPAGDRQ